MPGMKMRRMVTTSLGLATLALAGAAGAVEPVGYLDAAGCDVIAGWTQDPDEPAKAIDVHLYLGGPAGSGAPAVAVTANVYREDLCSAIGSCEHGFVRMPPLSLFDGAARDVYAYAIDSMGGPNPLLGASPKPLQCAPSASGVRRKVTAVSAVDAWRFNSFWDVLPLPAEGAAALAQGADLPDAPALAVPDDGSGALWLLDKGVRRAVPAGAIGPWRFDPSKAETRPAAELQAMVEGPAVRSRPVLVLFEGLALIDDPIPEVPDESTSSSGAGGGGGSGEGGSGAGGAGGNQAGGGGEGGSGAGEGGSGGGASGAAASGCAVGGGESRGGLAVMAAGCALAVFRRRRARISGREASRARRP
jgi:hypothetical protein